MRNENPRKISDLFQVIVQDFSNDEIRIHDFLENILIAPRLNFFSNLELLSIKTQV